MNVEHLKLFIRIAQTNNISAAGQELGLSPAVASKYINKLEEGLKVRLIHRTTRKVSLTQEGLAFLPHAEEVIAQVDAACASVGMGSTLPSGTLRIAAPASFGRMHLLPALKAFLDEYPDIKIDLRLSDTIIDLVEGGFDIAIRNAELKDSTLIARKLAPDRRIICASPNYIKQYGEPKTPEDLYQHECICLMGLENWEFSSIKNTNSQVASTKNTIIKVKGRFRTDNGEAIRDAALNDMGITISSTWSLYEHLKDGRIVQVLKDHPLASNTALWAVYPSSRLLAPKVRTFIDYLTQYFGDTPYWDLDLKQTL